MDARDAHISAILKSIIVNRFLWLKKILKKLDFTAEELFNIPFCIHPAILHITSM